MVRRSRARGFSLVELMVAVGVLALLVALLLPAISSIRQSARMNTELSAARQLMTAYAAYAAAHRDFVLPGHGDLIPNAPGDLSARPLSAFDAAGNVIAGGQLDTARKRWLWRLAPYMQHNVRGLYLNDNQDLIERLEREDHAGYLYEASVWPSLGLNTEWVGGDANAYGFLPPSHPLRGMLDMNHFYVTSMSQVVRSDQLLVFASSRAKNADANGGGVVEGYFKVISPYFTELTGARWSEDFNPAESPEQYGHISLRYGGEAVTAFIDGHTDTLDGRNLRDMRRWANWATEPDWRLPRIDN